MGDKASSDALQNAFNARLNALNAPPRFAVAVSGGRDSMALLRLCAAYARDMNAEFAAFTVDHGLRAESAKEAAQVHAWCAGVGVAHQTLAWKGEKPAAGVQAAARSARYKLLIEAAENHQCDVLLTAHTADDQAETLFMRLARGAGVGGLSGMSDETRVAAGPGAPIRLLRPLLAISRAAITDYLSGVEQQYFDDPSNDDQAYERIRVRALLAALDEQNLLETEKLAAAARKLNEADARLRAQEDALFETLGGCFHPWGGASLARWLSLSGASGLAKRLIFAVSGAEYAPPEADAGVAVRQAAEKGAATLSGALVRRWNDRLWFLREPAALTGRAGVAPAGAVPLKGPVLWDRRFIMVPAMDGLAAGPLGAGAEGLLGARAGLFHGPREALAGAPGLFSGTELIGAPALPFMGETRASARSLAEERYHGGIVRFL